MKNLSLLSVFLFAILFSYHAANAQDIVTAKKPIIKTKSDIVFKTKSISRDSFIVADVDNELVDAKLNVYDATKFGKRPAYAIAKTMVGTFGNQRLRDLFGERALVIKYYVTKKGDVDEVAFAFKNTTTVTADELAILQYMLLSDPSSKISFDIPAKATKGEDMFILRDVVLYRGVLDRTAF